MLHWITYLWVKVMLHIYSLVPLPLVYLKANSISWGLENLFSYRKKVITANLANAYPQMDRAGLIRIRKRFYQHLCDFLLESLKAFTLSHKKLITLCVLENPGLCDQDFEEGRSIVILTGHYGNWEWAGLVLGYYLKHRPVGVYKKQSNPYIDRLLRKNRAKTGLSLVSMEEVPRVFIDPPEKPSALVFISDQSPHQPQKAYWTEFLRQESGFMPGAGKLASRYHWPVYFAAMKKIQRGRYRIQLQKIHGNSADEIMEQYARLLEKQIDEKPEYWLWSHRRWKHQFREILINDEMKSSNQRKSKSTTK